MRADRGRQLGVIGTDEKLPLALVGASLPDGRQARSELKNKNLS